MLNCVIALCVLLSSSLFFAFGTFFYVNTLTVKQWALIKPAGVSTQQWQHSKILASTLLPFVKPLPPLAEQTVAYKKVTTLLETKAEHLNMQDAAALVADEEVQAELPDTVREEAKPFISKSQFVSNHTELNEITGSYGLNLESKTYRSESYAKKKSQTEPILSLSDNEGMVKNIEKLTLTFKEMGEKNRH
jgi:hypothetical protein